MREYLKDYQNVIYKTLLHSKQNHKFPQAILLNGTKDTPLLPVAKYVASWIVSNDDEPSDSDNECVKIKNGTYADLIIIDGKENTIKKGEIAKMQERFALSSIEEGAKKIYIINLVEKATSEAVNSLLKFLEEPSDDVYAIITTENIDSVLPTIISRCLNLHFRPASKQELVVESIKKNMPLEDALILSSFNGTVELMEECYNDTKYLTLKDLIIELFNEYVEGNDILYFSMVEMNEVSLNKNNFSLFLELLELFLLDVLHHDSDDINFANQKELLNEVAKKMKNIEDKLEKVMEYKKAVQLNANLKLLLDSIMICLKG